MEKQDFITLLNEPHSIQPIQTREVKDVIDKFPYFQSARVIYLKSLKDLQSFRYNLELKKTASFTTDRTILFDFITSKVFIEEKKIIQNEKNEENLTPEKNEGKSIPIIENPTLEVVKKAKEKLEIGKPLPFHKNEHHSFSKWLQISNSQEPIKRESKSEQENIIDKFITKNPKISKLDKTKPVEIKVISEPEYPQLMTETLAKIYLEQKKYDSAIKAYEILSLKYPEKSGFFADQIKQIKILQK